MDVLDGNLEAIKASGFRQHDFCGKVAAEIFVNNAVRCRKKARTWDMKCCSVDKSLFQSAVSAERSISSAVQKDASAFLYILQMSLCWMGKRTKRRGFVWRNGLGARWPFFLVQFYFINNNCYSIVRLY